MGITPNKIICFSIKDKTVDSSYFLEFMEEVVKKIGISEINKYIFILDNATINLTRELFEFYHKNKMKIFFGIPYMSKLNMIEYAFRYIKNIMNKKLYPTIDMMKNDLINIIQSNDLINTIPKLFRETLNKYMIYINDNTFKNLNS